jgi:TRAP-type C4-dicarboxylate transport system permease small subunit
MSDPAFAAEAAEDRFHPAPTLLEKACMVICEIAILLMGAIVILELITRNLFNYSFEMSDELGGYIIVGITFLTTHHTEDVAPTLLATPLWIPQAIMPIGMLAATISLLRSAFGNWRRIWAA